MRDTIYEEENEDIESEEVEETYQSMIESQIINHILDKGELGLLRDNGIGPEYFPGYEDEVTFIIEHHRKYKVVPDLTTFLEKFPEFELYEVHEAPASMLESIKEARGYALLAPALVQIDKLAQKNSIDAMKEMRDKAEEFLAEVSLIRFTKGTDLFKDIRVRYEEYLRRIDLKGKIGCVWNIPRFDDLIGGTREDDFLALQGRPGEGKSWIMEYLLLQPWVLQNKKILLFSLENNKEVVGYRADTLLKNFSNSALMSGKNVLGWANGKPSATLDDYRVWVEEAEKSSTPFLVMDNSDATLGCYTVEDIEAIMKAQKPDLVGIDQLSLLAPSRSFRTIREHYIHCTRSFRQMVNKYKIPIYLACQSGRDASKANAKNKEAAPELHQIAESDSVGQDATKVISLRNSDGILKLSVKKNTTGRSDLDALMRWDIDVGRLEPLDISEADGSPDRVF